MQISSTLRERLGDRLVVASISGGKDTALALTLMQHEISHVRVFAETGFEVPENYDYLDLLRERLGPIEVVRNESLGQGAQPGEEGMLTLMIKVGHEKRELRLLAWIAGGAGLGLGVLLGRWTKRDRRS